MLLEGIISLALIAAFLKRNNLKYGLTIMIIAMPFARIIQWIMGWNSLSKFWFNAVFIYMITALYLRFTVDMKYNNSIKFNKLDLVIMIFLLHGLLITYITYENYSLFTALNGFRMYFFGGIIYFVYRGYITTKNDINYLTTLLVMVILIVGIEVVLEFLVANILGVSPSIIPWLSGDMRGVLFNDPSRFITPEGIVRPVGLLTYIHFTGYVIGLGVLIVTPFAFILNKYRNERFFSASVFTILFICMIFSTTRSIVFLVTFLILFLLIKYKVSIQKVFSLCILICIVLVISYNLNFLNFLDDIFSSQNSYYRSFYSDPFENIAETDFLKIIFGRGVESGKYSELFYEEYKKIKEGFHFNQISDELHFFHYMDRFGVIGGVLYILQAIFAFQISIKASRFEKNPHFKKLLIGLSMCPLLYLFSSVHILHGDVIMQFFTYSILGIIGSYPQICHKDNLT